MVADPLAPSRRKSLTAGRALGDRVDRPGCALVQSQSERNRVNFTRHTSISVDRLDWSGMDRLVSLSALGKWKN